jgi:hypothetical protein
LKLHTTNFHLLLTSQKNPIIQRHEQINKVIFKGFNSRLSAIPNEENKKANPKNTPQPKYSIDVTKDRFFPICK